MSRASKLSPAKQALLEQRLKRAGSDRGADAAIPKRSDRDSAPLSFIQRQMWVIDQMTPGNPAYNMPYGFRVRGPLDVAALEKAFNAVIRRHEALRTTFAVRDGEPRQVIHPELEIGIDVTSLDHSSEEEREDALHRLASEESVRAFDLSSLPLIRVSLFELGAGDHVLIINLHHIIADGLSIGPLLSEVDTFYRAFTSGGGPRLPALPVQYGDFAEWQHSTAADEASLKRQIEFWREELSGTLPVLELPTDRPRPAAQSFQGSNVFFEIPGALAREVKALGEREDCTFFMTVLAAFQVLLHRYSGADDLVIGTPVTARNSGELEPLIGLFLNMVALRCDLSDDPSFSELLRRTRDTTLNAFSNGDVPLESVLKHLKFERDPSRNPIFQVALQVLSAPSPRIGELEVDPFHFDLRFAQFDLTLHLYEEEGAYRGRLEYCSDLFDATTIRRWCGHYLTLLHAIVEDPERRISALPLLTESERRQALSDWNRTESYERGPCLHGRFEGQVELTPDAVALVLEDEQVTYAQLNHRANRLAHRLRELGVKTDTLVGLRVERGVEMVVGILGILKAGGAYVPLDPAYPRDRVAFMMEDAALDVVVTQIDFTEELKGIAVTCVLLDEPLAEVDTNPPALGTADHLAYVIYTSGSTGKPKGVRVTHYNVTRLFEATDEWFGFGRDDVWTLFHSYAFDFSVWELWGALLYGGRLVIVPYLLSRTPDAFRELLVRERVTVLNQTPTAFRQLIRAERGRPKSELALRYVIFGGEALELQSLRPWFERYGDETPQLVNMYGITETTVHVTYRPIRLQDLESGRGSVIGEPIPDLQVYVLDRNLEPQPIGVPGELYVGGAGVARGYLNRSELTAQRFIPDPFRADADARLYRSGDLARRLDDGDLEYLGRLDQQVKIRGFRIELGEIEACIARHDAVDEVVVVAREDAPGDKRLVAYVVAESWTADLASELRERLQADLPDYMVPAAFVALDAIPLTPNGKLDRARLPTPERTAPTRAHFVAPRTITEQILAGIWAEILDLERVGVEDDFFDLGGNSLLAMRVISRVREALAVELPLRDLFTEPTVAGTARRVDALRRGAAPELAAPPLEPATERGPAELSFSQQRLWFLDQMESGRAYVMPGAIDLRGDLDTSVLERALGELVVRHESLRTTFVNVDGQPRQVVSEPGVWTLQVADLSGEPKPEERLQRLLLRDASLGFDLTQGPLFRARLYRLADDHHVLLLAMHHIVSDGWSLGVLFRELGELYERFARGETTRLPALPLQYRDYAVWQRRWLQGEALERLLAHWRSRLEGAPQVLELPSDRPRPTVESHNGALYTFTLPLELADALREFARREGATLYMTLLTGFIAMLSRYGGRQDLLVGTPVANRSRAEVEDVVGCFVNTIVLRADLSGDPSARELLGRMREVCLDAFAHQDLPFERLVEELRPTRDLSRNPVVQVLFALQNAPLRPLELPGLTQSALTLDAGVAQVDLTLQVEEAADGLDAFFEYATDLFDESTIARMATHWRTLLEAMVAAPQRRVSKMPLLTDAESRQLLVEWNATAEEYPRDARVHELVESQAARTPEAVAVRFEDQALTYDELSRRSNQLAHHVRTLGVGPNVRVGICLERSPEMVVGVLGVLKTGAAYVPLDPAFPEDRLRFMAEDAQIGALVSSRALGDLLDLRSVHRVLLDADADAIASAPDSVLPSDAPSARPEDPAYVIYTSGSTGRPKGVVVPHRAVVNFLNHMARDPGLTAEDILVAVTTLSFDIAVLEIWLPLKLGATVVIATQDETLDGRALGDLLERQRATVMQATPVTWRLLLEAGWTPERPFKALVGGEALPKDLADRLIALGVELWNLYGPTETTVWSTCARIHDTSDGITIGKPIANTTVRILDERGNLCPIGVPGELCIGGDGVSLGYWNRPELTADRFIPDPFGATAEARLYRTGDRARWRADGTLEHLGRLDEQIKLRGFRIEPGEIEARIAQHPAVREVAVIVREDSPGDRRLVAYLVAEDPPAGWVDQVRALVRAAVPEYMVPSHFVALDAMPRTQNRKLDRKALPAPDVEPERRSDVVAPRTATEAMVMDAFGEVLEREGLDVFDNFFDLGGHSLMAARLMSILRTASGLDLPLRVLFERPTIAALAEAIDAIAWAESSKQAPAVAGDRQEIEL